MGVHHHVAAGRAAAPRCESPAIVGNCGLCLGSPDCRTGSSCRKVLLGRRIPYNCCAFQSCYTHCSCWKGCSLAQRDWSRSISGRRCRVQSTACTHGPIDNKPFAATRISLNPEIRLVFVTLSVWGRHKQVLSNNTDDRSWRQPPSVLHARQSECGRAHTTP